MAKVSAGKIFRLLLPVLIIGIAVAIAAYLFATKSKPKPVTVTEKAWLVKIQKAELDDYSPDLTLYGKVDSLWSTQLTASVEADVLAVNVIEGDKVSKNQLLIKLDESERVSMLSLILVDAEINIQNRH